MMLDKFVIGDEAEYDAIVFKDAVDYHKNCIVITALFEDDFEKWNMNKAQATELRDFLNKVIAKENW